MTPAEADSVASRLDETFLKFRLHTHPAYFVGIQEATLEALIQANQRAELIQLAVDGLLSFVVAFDSSPVKLGRTTREEFLADLAFQIRVEGKTFSRSDLVRHVADYGRRKAFEILPEEFLKGYFAVGLLHESNGQIGFSVPYLEAYLLAERLRNDPAAAQGYFDPLKEEFDQFAFDLYVERGACESVVRNVCNYARAALKTAGSDDNAFLTKSVKPRALSSNFMLMRFAEQLSKAAVRIADTGSSSEMRSEKQRLLDARQAVRGKVALQDRSSREHLSEETRSEFALLDQLSRGSSLLATLVGSGAERLDAAAKTEVGELLLLVSERLLHHWTRDRLKIDFDELRSEVQSDGTIDEILEKMGRYTEDREDVRQSLLMFIDDQEFRLLSSSASIVMARLSQYAGVRSLRPTIATLKVDGQIAKILRDVWLMDVEHNDGRRALKASLQSYKGSPLLRLVIMNHLMNRIFWHHWQRDSRTAFMDVARYSVAPLSLQPAEEHARRVLTGGKPAQVISDKTKPGAT